MKFSQTNILEHTNVATKQNQSIQMKWYIKSCIHFKEKLPSFNFFFLLNFFSAAKHGVKKEKGMRGYHCHQRDHADGWGKQLERNWGV